MSESNFPQSSRYQLKKGVQIYIIDADFLPLTQKSYYDSFYSNDTENDFCRLRKYKTMFPIVHSNLTVNYNLMDGRRFEIINENGLVPLIDI